MTHDEKTLELIALQHTFGSGIRSWWYLEGIIKGLEGPETRELEFNVVKAQAGDL